MTYPINYKNISANNEFYQEVNTLFKEAESYLLGFKWCAAIKDGFVYINLGSTFCIFLFEIINTQSSNDNFLWVVAGDIPFMYLDVYGPKTTKEVVEDYIDLAEDWVSHVRLGKSVDDCYPFNTEPTLELANLLEKRALFMKNVLLENMEDTPLPENLRSF